jgi:hypothetical protein
VAALVSHESLKDWCRRQFDDADSIKRPWDKIAAKKNALFALATVDSKMAMELLRTLESPPYPAGDRPEDLRADAANSIFLKHWRAFGSKKISEIEETASWIGNTGEYPYQAMAFFVEELSRSRSEQDRNEAGKILASALNGYQLLRQRAGGEPKEVYRNANRAFVRILESGRIGVSKAVYGQALHVFVNDLLEDAAKPNKNTPGDVYTPNGILHFDNEAQVLVYRVWPLAFEFDPTWASQLKKDHPDVLGHAGETIEDIQLGVIEGPVTSESNRELQLQMSENDRLAKIESLRENNPWSAIEVALKLESPSSRIAALSSVLPNLVQVDPARAREVYSEQLDAIKGSETPQVQLNTMVGLAKAAFYVQDVNGFSDLTAKAFDFGIKLFKNSDGFILDRAGYDQLTDLVEFSTAHGVKWIIQSIRQVQDPELRAYLLIFAAEGIAKRQVNVVPGDLPLQTQHNFDDKNGVPVTKGQAAVLQPH